MALYLRIMANESTITDANEKRAIEHAFHNAPIRLTEPPSKHPRGGFTVYLDCTPDDHETIVQILEKNNLLSVI